MARVRGFATGRLYHTSHCTPTYLPRTCLSLRAIFRALPALAWLPRAAACFFHVPVAPNLCACLDLIARASC